MNNWSRIRFRWHFYLSGFISVNAFASAGKSAVLLSGMHEEEWNWASLQVPVVVGTSGAHCLYLALIATRTRRGLMMFAAKAWFLSILLLTFFLAVHYTNQVWVFVYGQGQSAMMASAASEYITLYDYGAAIFFAFVWIPCSRPLGERMIDNIYHEVGVEHRRRLDLTHTIWFSAMDAHFTRIVFKEVSVSWILLCLCLQDSFAQYGQCIGYHPRAVCEHELEEIEADGICEVFLKFCFQHFTGARVAEFRALLFGAPLGLTEDEIPDCEGADGDVAGMTPPELLSNSDPTASARTHDHIAESLDWGDVIIQFSSSPRLRGRLSPGCPHGDRFAVNSLPHRRLSVSSILLPEL